jgi:histidyl-tRNA synthetase
VGPASPAADAEICMMAADTLEELGIPRGQYVIKVNSRKVLDGVMEAIGLGGEENAHRRLTVLRAIDKLDRLGIDGVRDLLGAGRKDESGDFTKGAGLTTEAVNAISAFLERKIAAPVFQSPEEELNFNWHVANHLAGLPAFAHSETYNAGVQELTEIARFAAGSGYGYSRIRIDPSVVRGLEYYTGPVFEAELLATIPNEKGQPVVFGSVGGGGRYDGLVGRFMKDDVPATGFSIGVSRLQAALAALGKLDTRDAAGPVVVTVMDRDRFGDYQKMVADLRNAGVAAELYLGESGMKAQLKYADRRNAPLAVIQGGDEKARGVVQVKDLAAGKAAAAELAGHDAWKAERPGQFEVAEADLVAAVRRALGRED